MDQYTRRIIGFGIHAGPLDGKTISAMKLLTTRQLTKV
jgi:hypothetical protein